MKVALIHDACLPVAAYGGTERVVWWLAKGLHALGVEVTLAAARGTACPFANVAFPDFSRPMEPQLRGIDVFHYFNTPPHPPAAPYVVTIGGNGKPGEVFLPNTAFVSRNHAERHGAECYVHNGIDPDEYLYRDRKEGYLLFLAKASWRVKNVRGASRLARKAGRPLHVLGGHRRLFKSWRGVHWEGMLGGEPKARWLAGGSGLIFPVLWHEPFGLAVVEALVSGTPVVATPFGSLPELVPPEVGVLGSSYTELLEGIGRLGSFRPADCRAWVMERFLLSHMATSYRALYERVLEGESLNRAAPRGAEPADPILSLPD